MPGKPRKTRKQRAGALVGQGSFGCGFVPSLRCEGEEATPPDTLFSKLMFESEAKKELQRAEYVAHVDPAMTYSIYSKPEDMCKLHPEDIVVRQKELEECSLLTNLTRKNRTKPFLNHVSALTDLTLLRAPAASKEVHTFVTTYMKDTNPEKYKVIPAVFRSLRNLLEGLTLYHSQRFYHMDIKLENAVFVYDNRVPIQTKFIDFGLSVAGDQIDQYGADVLLRRYMYINTVFPFELYYATMPHKLRMGLNPSFLQEKIESFYDELEGYGPIPYDIFYNSRGSERITYSFAFKFFRDSLSKLPDSETYFRCSDLHALGKLLYTVMELVGNIGIENYNMKYGTDYRIPDPDAHKKIETFCGELYSNVIQQLMDLNPTNRIPAAEALSRYDACLKHLEGL